MKLDWITYVAIGAVSVLAIDIALAIFAPAWRRYKIFYFHRLFWIVVFNRCPRCKTGVNFDRNGRALCPDCGKPC